MVLRRRGRSAHNIADCVDETLSVLGMTTSSNNALAMVRGLHYPLPSSRPRMRLCVASVNSSDTNDLPEIDLSHVFSNPNKNVISSTVVIVDHYRFLILGYFDYQLPQNPNIREIFPHLPWRGELAVFSLGRKGGVLSRPHGARFVIHKAISVYIRAFIEARIGHANLPRELVFTSQSVFVI